jgi:hypothetical protein
MPKVYSIDAVIARDPFKRLSGSGSVQDTKVRISASNLGLRSAMAWHPSTLLAACCFDIADPSYWTKVQYTGFQIFANEIL